MADRKFKYYNDYQKITLKEYGRNVQKIIDFILTIEDREKRTRYAHTIVELMRQLNPNMRDSQDYNQKLWDHLYIMSGFRLDVDSEYSMPEKDMLGKKPKKLSYNNNDLKFKHYGRNVELLIARAAQLEDDEERESAIIYVGRLMKNFYSTWNKENIEDEVIWQQMQQIAGGKLRMDPEKIRSSNLFDPQAREWRPNRSNQSQSQQSGRTNTGNKKPLTDRRKK
jgi:hypothetical protein